MLYKKNVFARRKGFEGERMRVKSHKGGSTRAKACALFNELQRMKKASTNELVIPLTAGFLYWLKLNSGMAKTML